jgi:hypothetical protein
MKAFELVRDRAKALLKEAEAKGLVEAAKEAKIETKESGLFTRDISYTISGRPISMPSFVPEVGSDRKFIDECFQLAAEKKGKLRPITLTDKHMAVVVELLDEKAPRQALFERERTQLLRTVAQKVATESYEKAMDLKLVRERMKVVVDVKEEKDRGAGNAGVPMSDPLNGDE